MRMTIMKRTAACLVMMILAGATSAMAQGRTAGVLGGLHLANVQTEVQGDASRDDPRSGMFGGLTVMFPVQKAFGIEADVLFGQNGTEGSDGNGNEIKFHANYLSIPVMARYERPLGSQNLRFHALAGPPF